MHTINESVSPFQEAHPHPNPHVISPSSEGRKHMRGLLVQAIVLFMLSVSLASALLFLKYPQDTRSRASNTGPTLRIQPATKKIRVGDSFILAISMNTQGDTVSAVKLHLTYDKSAVRVTGFTPSAILPVSLTPAHFDNGEISVTLGSQPTHPFKGTGIIGMLSVKALTPQQSTFKFTDKTAVASIGKTSNSLSEVTNSSIVGSIDTTGIPIPTKRVTLMPSLTPASPTQTTETPTSSGDSFGSINTNRLTTSISPDTITSYSAIDQNHTTLPQPYTIVPVAFEQESKNTNNILTQIFFVIANFFQNVFSGLKR